MSIKSRYGNEVLDRIFRYFMRMVLHLQNSGIEKLPLENDFEEPLKSFMDIEGLYVWKNDVYIFHKDKHFWNRKHKFKISEITG